jgi:lysophospholipase L1-like esterase
VLDDAISNFPKYQFSLFSSLIGLAIFLPDIVKIIFRYERLVGSVAFDIFIFQVLILSSAVLILFYRSLFENLKVFLSTSSTRRDFFISFSILLGLFLIPELGFRFAGVVQPHGERTPFFDEFYDPVESQGLYDDHNYIGVVPSSNFTGKGSLEGINTNSYGYRGEELAVSNDTFVIAALGGSTTWGAQVSNDSMTYPSQLERMLDEQNPDQNFEVINAGVPGYTTAENIGNLHYRILNHDPDMVLLYNAYNDLKVNHGGCNGDYNCWRQKNEVERPLWSYSRFFTEIVERFSQQKVKRHNNITEEGLKSYRKNLKSLYGVSEKNDATLVVSTQSHSVTPENIQSDRVSNVLETQPHLTYKGFRRGMRIYNREISNFAKKRKNVLLVNNSDIPSNFEYHADRIHFTDKGSKEQASNFAEKINQYVQENRSR